MSQNKLKKITKFILKNKFKILFYIFIITSFALLAYYASILFVQNEKLKQKNKNLQVDTQAKVSPSPYLEPRDLSLEIKASDEVKGWQKIEGEIFDISFPATWLVETNANSHSQTIFLTAASGNTQLAISPNLSWGHGGDEIPVDTTEMIKIGDEDYQFTQRIIKAVGITTTGRKVWEDSVYEYAQLWDVQHKGEPYTVVFGNDYPLQVRSQAQPRTLAKFEQDKKVIKQILQTLKFKQEAQADERFKDHGFTFDYAPIWEQHQNYLYLKDHGSSASIYFYQDQITENNKSIKDYFLNSGIVSVPEIKKIINNQDLRVYQVSLEVETPDLAVVYSGQDPTYIKTEYTIFGDGQQPVIVRPKFNDDYQSIQPKTLNQIWSSFEFVR